MVNPETITAWITSAFCVTVVSFIQEQIQTIPHTQKNTFKLNMQSPYFTPFSMINLSITDSNQTAFSLYIWIHENGWNPFTFSILHEGSWSKSRALVINSGSKVLAAFPILSKWSILSLQDHAAHVCWAGDLLPWSTNDVHVSPLFIWRFRKIIFLLIVIVLPDYYFTSNCGESD